MSTIKIQIDCGKEDRPDLDLIEERLEAFLKEISDELKIDDVRLDPNSYTNFHKFGRVERDKGEPEITYMRVVK